MTAIGNVVRVGPGEGQDHRIGLDHFRTKGLPDERTEAFSVIEYEAAPGVPGPPPHVHRSFEEAWFILDGEVNFVSTGRTLVATPGTYLLVPRGIPHTFQVRGDRTARWLGIFSPGRYVGLVEELGGLIPSQGRPDLEAVVRLFARYDTELADGMG